ncbi:hypothetical protein AA0114_g10008 [Alternaria tenuissima]|uniref:Uncharacterized protein n=1 Tax=Alternaria tenuissima TaxID=119927 RepID=A0A4Q4M637_9PLEO|nr:hypothetical protein AA0114_g10008 [Alternaria tenuissima]
MAESFNKKRKAQVSELTLEDDYTATQHSRLPSSRTSASHNPLADRICTRRKTTKRQKIAQAKSDLGLGRESNALTFTDGPTNTSAADEGDIVMENTPVRDLIALPKGARAKRIKAKKRVVEEAEHEDDDVEVQERLRARLTIFDPEPHPAFEPWHCDFAAPTPPYDDQQACPIDWSKVTILHDDPLHCQEAYELRRPWDKKPLAWDKVAQKVFLPPFKDGSTRNISPEGGRKRFKAANKAVFELTGVYFPESSLGLEGHGIPLHKDLKPILEELAEAHVVVEKKVTAPFEGDAPTGTDPFVDREDKLSITDILR